MFIFQDGAGIIDSYKFQGQKDDFRIVMGGCKDEPTKTAWQGIFSNLCVREEISEFCKLAEILLCMPIGSVQNERAFSQMNLIKSDLRNKLGPQHLNAAMRVRRSSHNLRSLPVIRIVQRFLAKKQRRGITRIVS